MPTLQILINELGSPPSDDGTDPKNFGGELRPHSMIILEGGMASGDTSVMFNCVDDVTHKHYLVQLTGNLFRSAFGAFMAADTRFKDKRR